jgi:hypothetical protein
MKRIFFISTSIIIAFFMIVGVLYWKKNSLLPLIPNQIEDREKDNSKIKRAENQENEEGFETYKTAPKEWKIYSDDMLGLVLEHPADWLVELNQKDEAKGIKRHIILKSPQQDIAFSIAQFPSHNMTRDYAPFHDYGESDEIFDTGRINIDTIGADKFEVWGNTIYIKAACRRGRVVDVTVKRGVMQTTVAGPPTILPVEYLISGEKCGKNANSVVDDIFKRILDSIRFTSKEVTREELEKKFCENQTSLIGVQSRTGPHLIYVERETSLEWISSSEQFNPSGYKWECVRWYSIAELPRNIFIKFPSMNTVRTPASWAKYSNKNFGITFAYPQEAVKYILVEGRALYMSPDSSTENAPLRIGFGSSARYYPLPPNTNDIRRIKIDGEEFLIETARTDYQTTFSITAKRNQRQYYIEYEINSDDDEILHKEETALQILNSIKFSFDEAVINL